MGLAEEIGVSRAKDDGVENLGNHRDALGAPVAMDGKDEDTFRGEVGEIAQYSEDLRIKLAYLRWTTENTSNSYIPSGHGELR
jgi:hypothetical protein